MRFQSDRFTFGGAEFILVTPAINQRLPRPRAGKVGEWVHVPYGGNTFEEDGTSAHTVWTPPGGIIIPPQSGWTVGAANTNYTAIEALDGRFANLTTPWGTVYARLAAFENIVPYDDGSYRGPATWEWA